MKKYQWFSYLTENLFKKHRAMKLFFLLFTMALFNVHANSYAQTKRLTLNIENESIESVLLKIEAQSKFNFFYKIDEVDVKRKISMDVDQVSIKEILKILFKNQNVEHKVLRKQIVLKRLVLPKKTQKSSGNAETNSQTTVQYSISGTVTDKFGVPLPGANILEKGTKNGVLTDFDGNFAISVSDQSAILVVSYLGFRTKEIAVNNQTNLTVVLEEDVAGLDEVVVIGYGTTRRKDITGSVATIKLEDAPVSLRPTTSVLQSLQGTMAGVNVGPSNRPGQGPSFIIRGQNSINGSNDPLVVLDGMVYLGTVNDINPEDIATLDILKDASAAAIYGSRAANGVIMITTKRGKSSKPTIRFSSTLALNTWQNKPDLMNLEQWSDKLLAQLGAQNPNSPPTEIILSEDVQNSLFAQGIDTDWIDIVSRNSFTLNNQISVSGNSEKTNYYISAGYQEEEGVIVGDEYNRISIRSKFDTNITNWLKIGIDGTYNKNDYSGVGANLNLAYLMPPYAYPYRYEGMPENAAANTSRLLERWPMAQSIQNPLWNTNSEVRDDVDIRNFFRGAVYAQINVPGIDGLSYKINYTVNANFNLRDQFFHENYYVQAQTGIDDPFSRYDNANLSNFLNQANGSSQRRNASRYLMDNIINYKKQLGDHNIDLTAVATRDKIYNKEITVTGNGFSTIGNTLLGVNGIPNADAVFVTNNSNSIIERTNIGYLGRAAYTYKDKYHLSASIRRDGASVFGKGLKWGNFPSVGVAWTLSNEEFIGDDLKDKINYFKIKASYGTNGNQGLDPYQTLARISSGVNGGIRYEFGDNPSEVLYGTVQSNLASPNLGWEETTALNIGFESAFFNNRVLLNVDYYKSETRDQIFSRQIPIATGFTSILASLGQIDNSGIEISLTTNNIDNEDFKWSSTVNFWQNRNIIAELYGDDADGDGVEDDDIPNRYFIGKSIGAIYGYEYDGVVQESDTEYIANTGTQPGFAKYKDLNGDGLIDVNNDRKILGYTTPNFSMGLSNTFQYKNFSAYILITGIFGGGKDNYYMASNPRSNSFGNENTRNELNIPYWTPENQSEEYLSPIFSDNRYLGLQSRAFVRIQDINLSYKVPSIVLDNINISSLEIYTAINNAFIFTDWFGGGDPEYSLNGATGIPAGSSIYPTPSVYALGFKLSF